MSFQTQDQVRRASELPSRALLEAGLNGRSEKPEKLASCPIIESPLWGTRGFGMNMGKSSQLRSGNQGHGSRSTTNAAFIFCTPIESGRPCQSVTVSYIGCSDSISFCFRKVGAIELHMISECRDDSSKCFDLL